MAKKNKDQVQLAKEMLSHEHTRWRSWVIFYFTLLGAIAIPYKFLVTIINPFYISLGLTLISFYWLQKVLDIRRTAQSWSNTVNRLKKNEKYAYTTFRKEIRKYSAWKDYKAGFSTGRKHLFSSVARLFILLSLVFITGFGSLTIHFARNYKEYEPVRTAGNISRDQGMNKDTLTKRSIILYETGSK